MAEAGAIDATRLAVLIEANTKGYERAMMRLEAKTDRALKAVQARAKETAQGFDGIGAKINAQTALAAKDLALNIGGALGGGLAGALVGGGVVGAIATVREASAAVASIGDEAKRAGVAVEAFQELKFVSEQNRVELDGLVDGLKELSLRADEWIVTGAGPAAEAFQRLGYTTDDLARKLKNPSELFLEIIGRLGKLDKAAQLRIQDEVFGGTGGEKFGQLVDLGERKIREQIAAAHDLGIVMDAEVIGRAAEIDAKFRVISQTIETALKGAIVNAATALGDFIDRFNRFDQQNERNTRARLADVRGGMARTRGELEQARLVASATPGNTFLAGEVGRLEQQLADLTRQEREAQAQLDALTGAAKSAAPSVSTLGGAVGSAGATAAKAGAQFRTFAEGIAALSKEVPDLVDQMADLDARARIEDAYRATVMKARTMGEVQAATELRRRALAGLDMKPAREAAGGGLLDLIGYAEGTDKGRKYNETLGYGKFTGGPVTLTGMTLDEIDALQSRMLAHPENTYHSSAVGRYQITRTTLRGLRDQLGLSGGDYYTPELQDRLAQELIRRRGPDPAALRNEWEGLRRVDDATIMQAANGTALPPVDPSVTAARQAGSDVEAVFARASTEMDRMQEEAGKGADQIARMRYEAQLFDEVARARGGDSLVTEEDLARIKAAGDRFAQSSQQAMSARQTAAETAEGVFQGVASDLMSGADAADALKSSLKSLLAQLAQSEISNLFNLLGGKDTGGGSILSTIIGGILGIGKRAGGGSVNAGEPYIVGERRPEVFVPASAGRIAQIRDVRAPRIQTARLAPQRPQPVTMRLSVDLTGANGDAAIAAAMEQASYAGAARAISAVNAGAGARQIELQRNGR